MMRHDGLSQRLASFPPGPRLSYSSNTSQSSGKLERQPRISKTKPFTTSAKVLTNTAVI